MIMTNSDVCKIKLKVDNIYIKKCYSTTSIYDGLDIKDVPAARGSFMTVGLKLVLLSIKIMNLTLKMFFISKLGKCSQDPIITWGYKTESRMKIFFLFMFLKS